MNNVSSCCTNNKRDNKWYRSASHQKVVLGFPGKITANKTVIGTKINAVEITAG